MFHVLDFYHIFQSKKICFAELFIIQIISSIYLTFKGYREKIYG